MPLHRRGLIGVVPGCARAADCGRELVSIARNRCGLYIAGTAFEGWLTFVHRTTAVVCTTTRDFVPGAYKRMMHVL